MAQLAPQAPQMTSTSAQVERQKLVGPLQAYGYAALDNTAIFTKPGADLSVYATAEGVRPLIKQTIPEDYRYPAIVQVKLLEVLNFKADPLSDGKIYVRNVVDPRRQEIEYRQEVLIFDKEKGITDRYLTPPDDKNAYPAKVIPAIAELPGKVVFQSVRGKFTLDDLERPQFYSIEEQLQFKTHRVPFGTESAQDQLGKALQYLTDVEAENGVGPNTRVKLGSDYYSVRKVNKFHEDKLTLVERFSGESPIVYHFQRLGDQMKIELNQKAIERAVRGKLGDAERMKTASFFNQQ